MNKHVISLSAAAFLLAGCQTTSVNHLKTEGRIYFQYDQIACENIEFDCSEGYEKFSDKTGCGCQLTPAVEEPEPTEPADEPIEEEPAAEDTDTEPLNEEETDEEVIEEDTAEETTEDTTEETDNEETEESDEEVASENEDI